MKRSLGQFFSTQSEKLLTDLVPHRVGSVIEPFYGNGDLIKGDHLKGCDVEAYDIEPKNDSTVQRNTLLNPPIYSGKTLITNPPYLAKNKNTSDENEIIYAKYNQDDLYKCFIETVISDPPAFGIIVIPLNFWSSVRKGDVSLRERFIRIFKIIRLNIFEEPVFDDTTYSVCSFSFELGSRIGTGSTSTIIDAFVFPEGKNISLKIIGGVIGGPIKVVSGPKMVRVTKKNKNSFGVVGTFFAAKCLDTNKSDMIALSYLTPDSSAMEEFIDNTPKQTARAKMLVWVDSKIDNPEEVVKKFNDFLNKHRAETNSLFLSNFRDVSSVDSLARKRISFAQVFEIIRLSIN